jgi:hypothetical protein
VSVIASAAGTVSLNLSENDDYEEVRQVWWERGSTMLVIFVKK